MTHEEFEELVSAYIDYEVTPEEKKALLEHMEACTSCRGLYKEEKIIKEKLHRLKDMISIPPDLQEKLTKSIEKMKRKRFLFNPFHILPFR